ncbi:hypothetical protein CJF30_00005124 [Rutstroemia sp. NJR-2017a BBW]|nr:hypothetical protein CJF30_00005124 [Rutstroemia sp. NJR-2017a BBW]
MGFSAGTSRAERKAKKRKLENSIPDVPEDLETESANEEISSAKRKRDSHDGADGNAEQDAKKSEHIEKSDPKAKRTKVNSTDAPSSSIPTGDQEAGLLDDENAPKKSKKERKAERKAREAAAATATPQTVATAITSEQNAPEKASRAESAKTNAGTSVRKRQKVTDPKPEGKACILLTEALGNLPFTATTASIQKHFAAVKPLSIRHQTEKGNASKSKGYAFLEFEGYDHMKTCLKQFHQSTFKDDLSAPRKINVELTAGGGGNTKDRRTKIQEKNQKLNEQRIRQAQETENKVKGNKNSGGSSAEVLADDSGMHPSRRARIAG